MERRDFVAAMSVFVGASFAGRQAYQIITPAQGLWVPIQGEYTVAELDGVLKRVYAEPLAAHFSAEQLIVNDMFSRVIDMETRGEVYFRREARVAPPVFSTFGPRKRGVPEIVVKNSAGVRIESRPA